jgi:hypothetical protein
MALENLGHRPNIGSGNVHVIRLYREGFPALPGDQTRRAMSGSGTDEGRATSDWGAPAPTMAHNIRVSVAGLMYLASYLLLFLLGFVAVAWVLIAHVDPSKNDTALGLVLGGALLWFLVTMSFYLRYVLILFRAALQVPSGAAREELPRVLDPAAQLVGQEFDRDAQVKTLLGRAGKCRIELYGNGIRIWRGRSHPEPSWSFVYTDLLQAELVALLGGPRGPAPSYLRLIAARPRMAFLISSKSWTGDLIKRLGDHDVPTFGDS